MKPPFIEFFVEEVYEHKQLRNIRSSLTNYWLGTLRDDTERDRLERLIRQYEGKEQDAKAGTGSHTAAASRQPAQRRAGDKDDDDKSSDRSAAKTVKGSPSSTKSVTAASSASVHLEKKESSAMDQASESQ